MREHLQTLRIWWNQSLPEWVKELFLGLLLLGLVVLFWYWSWKWIDLHITSTSTDIDDQTAKGLFGDKFGAVNALFSALAFAGIIFTILLQRKELALQRKELKDTRAEFEAQNQTLRLQRFENTFFQMLSLHHEIVDKIYHGKKDDKKEGREALKSIAQSLEAAMNSSMKTIMVQGQPQISKRITNTVEAREQIIRDYIDFHRRFNLGSLMNHYFRNLYHIFKFVYSSELVSNSDKQYYASLIRAQLSDDELFFIFYNSMIPGLGKPNFLFLIREFDIMDNFDFSRIVNYDYHIDTFREEMAKAEPKWKVAKPQHN
jgi:hypothetical protein